MNLTDQQIQKILESYKKKREKENKYYHEVSKNKDDFKIKNRARAKQHYENNKDKKKEKYINNKDLISAKNLYKYYQKRDRLETFEEKHPTKMELLRENNFIKVSEIE
tara:strand:- start:8457 stop:8780 length:324 start_codon:yes stop_codon:yes gene_type:complete